MSIQDQLAKINKGSVITLSCKSAVSNTIYSGIVSYANDKYIGFATATRIDNQIITFVDYFSIGVEYIIEIVII